MLKNILSLVGFFFFQFKKVLSEWLREVAKIPINYQQLCTKPCFAYVCYVVHSLHSEMVCNWDFWTQIVFLKMFNKTKRIVFFLFWMVRNRDFLMIMSMMMIIMTTLTIATAMTIITMTMATWTTFLGGGVGDYMNISRYVRYFPIIVVKC